MRDRKLVDVACQITLSDVGRRTVAECVSVSPVFHTAGSRGLASVTLLSSDPVRRHAPLGRGRRHDSSAFIHVRLLHVIGRHGGKETESSVSGELLVDLSHPLNVQSTGLRVVHHGFGIIHPDHAPGGDLHVFRRVPGIVDELGWKISEGR